MVMLMSHIVYVTLTHKGAGSTKLDNTIIFEQIIDDDDKEGAPSESLVCLF